MDKSFGTNEVLFVDGHNLLFRYFWGMPQTMTTKDKKPCHGAFGFISSILNYVKSHRPKAVIVFFDSNEKPSRISKLESYKENRIWEFEKDSLDNPFTQMTYIQDCLNYLKIQSIEISGVEADDLIGSSARVANERGCSVTISSTDRDFLQLVEPLVRLYIKRGKNEIVYTPEKVKSDFGIRPRQYVDFKALSGDKSDNIYGVPGVGPKTASSLIADFDSLDGIYQNLDTLSPRLCRLLNEHKDRVYLNREVITIDRTIDVLGSEFSPLVQDEFDNLTVRTIFTSVGIW